MAEIFTVRASSFGGLFDCGYRWEGTHILGIQRPSSGAAHLGTAIHAAAASFDAERMAGTDILPDDAAGLFVRALHNPEAPVLWGDDSIKRAELIGIKLTTKYCTEFSPQFEYRAVEMQLKPMDISTQHGIIRLTGRMDRARVAATGKGLGVWDLKSGKRAVDSKTGAAVTKGHAPQIGIYSLLTAHTLEQPVTEPGGIIGLQTVDDARIGTAQIPNAVEQLVGTPEQPGLIEMAARILHTGVFSPNPQSRLCSQRYCNRWDSCRYHG